MRSDVDLIWERFAGVPNATVYGMGRLTMIYDTVSGGVSPYGSTRVNSDARRLRQWPPVAGCDSNVWVDDVPQLYVCTMCNVACSSSMTIIGLLER